MNLYNIRIHISPFIKSYRAKNYLKATKSLIVSGALMSMLVSTAYGAIALDRTRVVFDGDLKSISLNVSNQNKQLPYLAQGWMEDEAGNKIQSPFTVLPPVQRIDAGKPSQVKIQLKLIEVK